MILDNLGGDGKDNHGIPSALTRDFKRQSWRKEGMHTARSKCKVFWSAGCRQCASFWAPKKYYESKQNSWQTRGLNWWNPCRERNQGLPSEAPMLPEQAGQSRSLPRRSIHYNGTQAGAIAHFHGLGRSWAVIGNVQKSTGKSFISLYGPN